MSVAAWLVQTASQCAMQRTFTSIGFSIFINPVPPPFSPVITVAPSLPKPNALRITGCGSRISARTALRVSSIVAAFPTDRSVFLT